jgi:hypothetical protein
MPIKPPGVLFLVGSSSGSSSPLSSALSSVSSDPDPDSTLELLLFCANLCPETYLCNQRDEHSLTVRFIGKRFPTSGMCPSITSTTSGSLILLNQGRRFEESFLTREGSAASRYRDSVVVRSSDKRDNKARRLNTSVELPSARGALSKRFCACAVDPLRRRMIPATPSRTLCLVRLAEVVSWCVVERVEARLMWPAGAGLGSVSLCFPLSFAVSSREVVSG